MNAWWPWGTEAVNGNTGATVSLRHRYAVLIACIAGCSLVTWLRYLQVDTLKVDDQNQTLFNFVWPKIALGVFLSGYAWQFWKIYERPPSMRTLVVLSILTNCVAAFALPLTSNDLFSNIAYGRLALHGNNPYTSSPADLPLGDSALPYVASRWRYTPSVYGPVLTLVEHALATVRSLRGEIIAWKLLTLALTLVALVLARSACSRHRRGDSARKRFAFISLAPAVVWELSAQTHNDALPFMLTTGFVWAAITGYEWLALSLLVIATCAKTSSAIILGLYLAYAFRRNRARAVGMSIWAVAFGSLLVLPYWEGWSTLRAPMMTLGGDAGRTSRSLADLANWLCRPFGAAAQALTYRILWLASVGSLSLLFVRALGYVRSRMDVLRHSSLLFGVYCLSTPWFQPWYVTWLIPTAFLDEDESLARVVALYAALTPIQYVLPLDPLTTVVVNSIVIHKYFAWHRWASQIKRTATQTLT